MRRILAGLIVLLACSAPVAATATAAHNVLIGSSPKDGARLDAPPETVVLEFDQTVRQGFARITVTGPDGTRPETGEPEVRRSKVTATLGGADRPGDYVIGYRVLSSDGHPIAGKITFRLTAAPASAAPASEPAAQPPTEPAAQPATQPAAAPAAVAADEDLSARAAEAAQNGGAGMAVLWIGAAIVFLGGATIVAMRRTRVTADE
ncbi:copper resistance CopC family protein [Spongiactinospora sp. TRM90649]|uniref:copper resistance CopC family protein n=1 Tax=Spongiactinospora sp. TRM90649 TaxID=3031114 RepID=UPI0023F9AF98|nr:copper resistance CopC family protein [Spongiactinospora sp. TRM90649]MDF5758110.1 copper resistance protein CopC [Spongiactinospora sp. TRM90649]